uniref:Uncharacterized protein n=1 Tax=Cucumis melo TaxID=3656 RepID=A0A9I9EA25_CUCME
MISTLYLCLSYLPDLNPEMGGLLESLRSSLTLEGERTKQEVQSYCQVREIHPCYERARYGWRQFQLKS